MNEISKRISALSAEKRALLARLLAEEGRASDSFPLSFAQERLWFLNKLQPDSPFYNINCAVRLKGRLNVPAVEHSLNELARRHEILRATFPSVNDRPMQIVRPVTTFKLPLVDLNGLESAQRESEAGRLIQEESLWPFDLEEGPVLRTVLLRLGQEEQILAVVMHHIVSDGWSVGVVVREFAELYESFASGQQSSLSELPIQYSDYAVWQRQWLSGDVLEGQLTYWRNQLDGAPPILELPADHPRPSAQTFRGARQRVAVGARLVEVLRGLSQQEGATLFMVLLAAFQALLSKYTRQEDVVVGSVIANRNRAETEGVIGLFVNSLVMRTDTSGDPTARELIGRVREGALGAYAHQDLPFEKLVEDLHSERRLSHNPVFQVMFVLQNAPIGGLELPEISMELVGADNEAAQFDLTLELWETEDGINGSIEYATDLFQAATVERMAGHFQTLLEAVASDPDQRLSGLPVLTRAERHQLIYEWNQTQTDYSKNACIQELFEAQVRRSQEATAVVFQQRELTYRELNSRANQLAHYLRRKGVGPETLVGICMERSAEMIVGLLGILKAGGTYLPLDPGYPNERLSFIANDARPFKVVTQSHLTERLPEQVNETICLDKDWSRIAEESGENPGSIVTPGSLVYVIYTSGSTGKPKGVMIQHGSLVNYVESASVEYDIKPGDRVLQFTSLSFDWSGDEIYPCLTKGGCLVLRTEEMISSIAVFLTACEELGLAVIMPPTAFWHEIAEALGRGTLNFPSSIRLVVIGGEKALPERLAAWRKQVGNRVRLINAYGPTETTITVATCDLSQLNDELRDARELPIGRPIRNTELYVLDSHRQLVPIGIIGGLHVGGIALARGYLHEPELTADKFIPDPFGSDAGGRLYETGDLVRCLTDGNIEFSGRVDEQVKVRGYRVELGEIEWVLNQHLSVSESVVLALDDHLGNKRLVAYVVRKKNEEVMSADLQRYVKQKLPEYMVPSAFVMMEELPLTANGKLDRRALPAPDQSRVQSERRFLAPRTAVEEVVSNIWAEVLEVEQVGVEDNFFEMGGHSLLATQVISRVREAFGVEVGMARLFEYPSVGEFAREVEKAIGEGKWREAPAIERVERKEAMPLSYAQQRLWFIDRLEPDSSAYNIASAFRLSGDLKVIGLENALSEIVRRHEVLRTTFATHQGKPIQVITPYEPEGLPIVDLTGLQGNEANAIAVRVASEDSTRAFDLQRDSMLRVSLVRLTEQEHGALITIHHVASDEWSTGILVRELATLYEAFSHGRQSPLEELSVQYADYAVWQRNWLQGKVLQKELRYWRTQLAGAPAVLELPVDRPRPAIQSYRGGKESLVLPRELSDGLMTMIQREGITLFMLLLAAFKTLLYRYSGQGDIVVGTPIANRSQKETEGLIGFFLNTLVMRTSLAGNLTFRGLIERVREIAFEAYAHQELPFEKLVEELQPERSLSHAPLFQVMFLLQVAERAALQLPGISLNPIGIENNTSKYDLTLVINDSGNELTEIIEYNSDLFDAATITRIAGHMQTLLESIVRNPEQRLSDLPLLSEAERQRLMAGQRNDAQSPYPGGARVHDLIELQVELRPDSIAIVFESEQLTYSELNLRANQLAHHLQSLGVGPDQRVGICIDRSLEMVLALLGTLKAGAAYVPLDPAYPKERIAFMMIDAGIAVLLCQQSLLSGLPEHGARVVCLDADRKQILAHSDSTPFSQTVADNLAYVIYTSGSTGRPKGVEITHRSVVNVLGSMGEQLGINGDDVLLAVTTLSFDIAGLELYLPLTVGATVALVKRETTTDPSAMIKMLDSPEVTVMQATPSMWRMLVEAGWRPNERLKTLCGGEALTRELANSLAESSGGVWNLYGPTETTIYSTGSKVEMRERAVSIGDPIAGTQVYILDGHLQMLPFGVLGELCIGGAGLARCYHGRPDATAERFIPDPSAYEAGLRLYKTGDQASHLAEGGIVLAGRSDYQVKLRGYRIELAEIERTLEENDSVRQAVVVAREDQGVAKRLVAYVLANGGFDTKASELRSYLKRKLPEYMVPSAFVMMEELPLTANGKLDRRALPAPDQSRVQSERRFLAPRTAVEEVVSNIWAEVLEVEQVGVEDNFFEMGGHSLLATQVISRVREAFGVEVGMARLFEYPSVGEFAREVEKAIGEGKWREAPAIERVERKEAMPLSFAQQRLWFIDRLMSGSAFYNIPVAVRLKGSLDVVALDQSFNEIVRRHEVLRTAFFDVESGPVQIIAPDTGSVTSMANLFELPEDEREDLASQLMDETFGRPFNLSGDKLLRVKLLKLYADEHVLALTMPHIVSDGWSVSILIQEFTALYEGFQNGDPSSLPELDIQFADYAGWQRNWLRGEALEAELSYWKQQLLDITSPPEVPADRPRPALQTFAGAARTILLSRDLTESLKALTRSESVTMFMALLAALDVLLCRQTGQQSAVVGTPIANRRWAKTEPLIGCFINMLVLRSVVSPDATFRELLKQVREVTLNAYAHQDLPFEKLVEALNPDRDMSRTPFFQVVMAFQNVPMPQQGLPGLSVIAEGVDDAASHFDLHFGVQEMNDSLSVTLTYNTDLFERPTADRLLREFEFILTITAEEPDASLGSLTSLLFAADIQHRVAEGEEFKAASAKMLRNVRRKAVVG